MKKISKCYGVFDFETTTDLGEFNNIDNITFSNLKTSEIKKLKPTVYAWAISFKTKLFKTNKDFKIKSRKWLLKWKSTTIKTVDTKYTKFFGLSIDSFIDLLLQSKRSNITLFGVNNAKFDNSYIIKGLMNNSKLEYLRPNLLKEYWKDNSQKENIMDRIIENKYIDYFNKRFPIILDIAKHINTDKRFKKPKYDISTINSVTNFKWTNMNFTYDNKNTDTDKKIWTEIKNLVSSRLWDTTLENEWSVVSTKKNQHLFIQIKDKKTVEIRDIRQLFIGSVKSFGNTLNTQYKINCDTDHSNCYCKLEGAIDYKKYKQYQTITEFIADKNEFKYLNRDIDITYEYIEFMKQSKLFGMDKWKYTTASTAYNYFLDTFKTEKYNQYKKIIYTVNENWAYINKKTDPDMYNRLCYLTNVNWKPRHKYKLDHIKDKIFKGYFNAEIFNTESETEIRTKKQINDGTPNTIGLDIFNKYYIGGIVYNNPKYQNKPLNNINKVDYNSLYPSTMIVTDNNSPYKNNIIRMPIGDPLNENQVTYSISKKRELYGLYKVKITAKIYFKCLPFIRVKQLEKNDWMSIIDKNKVVYLDTYSLELLKKYGNRFDNLSKKFYEILEIQMLFNTVPNYEIFGTTINRLKDAKINAEIEGDLGTRTLAKLLSNSIYGKFTEKPFKQQVLLMENGIQTSPSYTSGWRYIPIGLCITSIARFMLVNTIGDNWMSNGVYVDTDSLAYFSKIHHIVKPMIHPTKYGKLKLENREVEALFSGRKQYAINDKIGSKNFSLTLAGYETSKNKQIYVKKDRKYLTKFLRYVTIEEIQEGLIIPTLTSVVTNSFGVYLYNKYKILEGNKINKNTIDLKKMEMRGVDIYELKTNRNITTD